jgi:hypothetical protein
LGLWFGGGIYIFGGTNNVTNTIVANNRADTGGVNCYGNPGGGFNLSNDNSCAFGVGRDNRNVMLAPLGNYGGPTLTQIPLPGSPAIDDGTGAGCPSTDQRGKGRPAGAACDVGAVEVQVVDFSHWLNLPLIMK